MTFSLDNHYLIKRVSIGSHQDPTSRTLSPRGSLCYRVFLPFNPESSSEGGIWAECKIKKEINPSDFKNSVFLFTEKEIIVLDKEKLKKQSFSIYKRVLYQSLPEIVRPLSSYKSRKKDFSDYPDFAIPNLKKAIELSLQELKIMRSPHLIEKIEHCFQTSKPIFLNNLSLVQKETPEEEKTQENQSFSVCAAGKDKVLILTNEIVGKGSTVCFPIRKGYLLTNQFGYIKKEAVACRFLLNEQHNFEIERRAFFEYQNVPGVIPSLGICQYRQNSYKIYTIFLQKYCKDGNLLQYLKCLKKDPQLKAHLPMILKRILEGLYQIHWRGDVHRDLKLENIFLDELDPFIGDLGSLCPQGSIQPFDGTLEYLPPEIHYLHSFAKDFIPQKSADIWSLGCIFFILYYEKDPPFFENPKELAQYFQKGKNYFRKSIDYFKEPSEKNSFAHLIWSMLRVDPRKRISVKKALEKMDQLSSDQILCSENIKELTHRILD